MGATWPSIHIASAGHLVQRECGKRSLYTAVSVQLISAKQQSCRPSQARHAGMQLAASRTEEKYLVARTGSQWVQVKLHAGLSGCAHCTSGPIATWCETPHRGLNVTFVCSQSCENLACNKTFSIIWTCATRLKTGAAHRPAGTHHTQKRQKCCAAAGPLSGAPTSSNCKFPWTHFNTPEPSERFKKCIAQLLQSMPLTRASSA